jgi:hypothetical protein
MSIARSIVAVLAAALLAVPPAAIAVGRPPVPGNGHRPAGTPAPSADTPAASTPRAAGTPGPGAPASAKAKAYGKLCQGESKKHVAGAKGTAFSRCVTAMAKAASGEAKTARDACAGLSHKHTAGGHGTPFSRCVVAAAKVVDRPAAPAGA